MQSKTLREKEEDEKSSREILLSVRRTKFPFSQISTCTRPEHLERDVTRVPNFGIQTNSDQTTSREPARIAL